MELTLIKSSHYAKPKVWPYSLRGTGLLAQTQQALLLPTRKKPSSACCARAYIESSDPRYDKVRGGLPVVGLLSRILGDNGGFVCDCTPVKEFCSRVYCTFAQEATRTFLDSEDRHGSEDNLFAGCCKSLGERDNERLNGEEDLAHLNELLARKVSALQVAKQNEAKRANLAGTASAAALALAWAGLISCSPAWAGTDIARVQDTVSWLGDLDDIKSGFLSAFLLIFFSEIGDKTFFIAAILAARKSNAAVFTGTFGALVAMTFISVFLGRTFHYIDGILPFSLGENELPIDDVAAVILLVYFGISTLLEAASMEGSKAEEEQQEAELAIAGLGIDGDGPAIDGDGSAIANTALATFGLVFVAEWGDKSFFSTVALSAASSPLGVVSGAIAGHGIATLLAVLGGSFLSNYISERVTAYIGGSLFLIFAAFTLYEIVVR